jgi:hypothetical protein
VTSATIGPPSHRGPPGRPGHSSGPWPLPDKEADQVRSPRRATPSAHSKWPAREATKRPIRRNYPRSLGRPAWLVCWRPWVPRRGSCRGCIQRRHRYITRGRRAICGISGRGSHADGPPFNSRPTGCAPRLVSAAEPVAAPNDGFELRSRLSALPRSEAPKNASSSPARSASARSPWFTRDGSVGRGVFRTPGRTSV